MNNLNTTALTTTAPIIIENINIRQDSQGRFCLNDLHKAAGGHQKHRPKYWLENQQTKDLIAVISKGGIPPFSTTQPIKVTLGASGGTFVIRKLVYVYTAWISPEFHSKVYDILDAHVTGQLTLNQPTLPNFTNPSEAARAWANEYDGRLVAEQKVTALEPKAAFAEEYLEADHNVALRYAAQELGLPPNIFNEKLRADKVLYTIDSRKNMPYQYYLEKGYFVVKTRVHARTGRAHLQTLVTPKGLYWLNKKYSHLKGLI